MGRSNDRHRQTLWLLALLLVLAAGTRFTGLDYAPAGGDGDTAWVALDGLDWVDRGARPYYLDAAYTPEPIMPVLDGLFIRLFGISHVTPRLVTATNGVLMVGLAFLAAWWLLGPDQPEELRATAGLLSAASATVSLHIIHLSRQGLRAPLLISVLLLLTWLTAWAWWRGGWWRWLLAGVALSLTQYTYISGRVAPFFVIFWFLWSWWSDPARFRRQFKGWLLMAGVAFVLVLPTLITYIQTPDALLGRVESASAATGDFFWKYDLSRYGGVWGLVGRKLLANLQIIGLRWDAVSYTAMAQPILAPLFFGGVLLALGMAFTRRWRRQIVFVWPLLGLPVMILPDVISGTVIMPHPMRQVGAVTFWVLLSGLGMAVAVRFGLARLANRSRLRQAGIALLGLLIVVPSGVQFYRYMAVYTPARYADPDTAWHLEQTDLDIAYAITSAPDRAYLLPYHEYTRWNMAWITADAFRFRHSPIDAAGQLRIADPPDTLTIVQSLDPHRARHDGQSTAVDTRLWVLLYQGEALLLPPLTAPQQADVLAALDETPFDPIIDRSGTVVAELYTGPAPSDLFAPRDVRQSPLDTVFYGPGGEPELRLVGYAIPEQDLPAGETVFVTLFWEVLQPPSESHEFFVQLWDDDQHSIAGAHGLPYGGTYRTRIWLAGEVVATHHRLDLPAEIDVGRYSLAAGVYRQLHNTPLRAEGAQAAMENTLALMPDLRVAPSPDAVSITPMPQPVEFGTVLAVAGLDVTVEGEAVVPGEAWTAQPGQVVDVALAWAALARPPVDYSTFLHLDAAPGQPPITQTDAPIRAGFPTGAWRPGEQYADRLTLPLPANLPAGTYDLYLGVYFWQTGERLPPVVGDASGDAALSAVDDRLWLGRVVVD